MTDDISLVGAARKGDDEAFGALVSRYADAVYRFAYRYVRTGADAEDITQETFVRAWRHLKRFDESKSMRAWLFAIARNAALDLIKKKKPLLFSQIASDDGALDALAAPQAAGMMQLAPAGEAPDAAFDRKAVQADLARVLSALPPVYRTVLTMRYHGALKFREIAAALGEPIDTVKSRHRRGLALLKKTLGGGATGSRLV